MMGTARKGHRCPVLPGLLLACATDSDAFTAETAQGLSYCLVFWLFLLDLAEENALRVFVVVTNRTLRAPLGPCVHLLRTPVIHRL